MLKIKNSTFVKIGMLSRGFFSSIFLKVIYTLVTYYSKYCAAISATD